jgi:hypothetical protein
MANRCIIIIVFFIIESSLYSQMNISFDNNCSRKNSAIFAQSMIEYAGEDKVAKLLENKIKILTFWEVDSLGRIIKFKKILGKELLSEGFIDSLEIYLIKNDKRFFICYEKIPGYCDRDAYKITTKKLFEENKKAFISNLAFPGELIINYDLEKANNQTGASSKYIFLQEQIKKYIQP